MRAQTSLLAIAMLQDQCRPDANERQTQHQAIVHTATAINVG